MQDVKNLNGSEVDMGERRNAELHYLKKAYEEYMHERKLLVKMDLHNEDLVQHMNAAHPRWYELVAVYGNPIEMISLKPEGTNIATTSAKVTLASDNGKKLDKKLLLNMTVKDLKSMCAKLFKIEVLQQKLVYSLESMQYELDEDLRQLSYYSIQEGGLISVKVK